jgi:hypothetical protein
VADISYLTTAADLVLSDLVTTSPLITNTIQIAMDEPMIADTEFPLNLPVQPGDKWAVVVVDWKESSDSGQPYMTTFNAVRVE